MTTPATSTERLGDAIRARHHDAGITFIEVLVAIVLMGTLVVATLAGIQATIFASRVDRDHAAANAWLQSSTDVLYGVARIDCGTPLVPNEAAVIAAYDSVVKPVDNPENWPDSRIAVTDVQFWNGASFGTGCLDDIAKTLQLITIVVYDASASELESVQIVKGGNVGEIP